MFHSRKERQNELEIVTIDELVPETKEVKGNETDPKSDYLYRENGFIE
ncbi:hypothetical protein MUN89_08760 [Halobacillus salinarum]|uniref:Uncharacterized protein n=1 Tax=Halobacillus salinarum TaxID=2932257 RepID=A0ABY4EPH2_9BACI|nr:hypothetical protein [Halobacillus salinarum]UOQ45991.1 hypothetical protein MUN89_08760 [Halobacillus salinarum]